MSDAELDPDRERQRGYERTYVAEHITRGLCVSCARVAAPGKRRCREHLKRQAARTAAWRERARRDREQT